VGVGDHSAQTFKPLWDEVVSKWKCYFYVTDGWKVYPMFIPDGDHIVWKTQDLRTNAIYSVPYSQTRAIPDANPR
jgi:IS1 family transposase